MIFFCFQNSCCSNLNSKLESNQNTKIDLIILVKNVLENFNQNIYLSCHINGGCRNWNWRSSRYQIQINSPVKIKKIHYYYFFTCEEFFKKHSVTIINYLGLYLLAMVVAALWISLARPRVPQNRFIKSPVVMISTFVSWAFKINWK